MAVGTKEERAEKLKKRIRDTFVLFEHKEGSRMLDMKEVGSVIRALGVNPTAAQINCVLDQLAALNTESDSSNMVNMDNFESVAYTFLTQQEASLFRDDYHSLLRAFRAFDPEGRGYVEADQMKTLLATKGEVMSDEELSRMVGFAGDEQGRLFYEDYAQKLATDGRQI